MFIGRVSLHTTVDKYSCIQLALNSNLLCTKSYLVVCVQRSIYNREIKRNFSLVQWPVRGYIRSTECRPKKEKFIWNTFEAPKVRKEEGGYFLLVLKYYPRLPSLPPRMHFTSAGLAWMNVELNSSSFYRVMAHNSGSHQNPYVIYIWLDQPDHSIYSLNKIEALIYALLLMHLALMVDMIWKKLPLFYPLELLRGLTL